MFITDTPQYSFRHISMASGSEIFKAPICARDLLGPAQPNKT